jgi:uncharacterized membrane protein YccC
LSDADELLLQSARRAENVLDQFRRNSRRVAKPLRQVEHQTVDRFRRRLERRFGALALL